MRVTDAVPAAERTAEKLLACPTVSPSMRLYQSAAACGFRTGMKAVVMAVPGMAAILAHPSDRKGAP